MGAAILVLQWQGENWFSKVEKFEISHFQAVHCVRKNAISPKVFNRFSKTFHLLKDVECRYSLWKFHERSYFSFAMARRKFFLGEKFETSNFQAVHCMRKNAISPKVFNRFSQISLCWKMWKIGISVENIMGTAILVLQWQGENWFTKGKFETSHFQAVHCVRKNAISPKLFNRCWKMWNVGIRFENLMGAAI